MEKISMNVPYKILCDEVLLHYGQTRNKCIEILKINSINLTEAPIDLRFSLVSQFPRARD